jgi:hypothetical protein
MAIAHGAAALRSLDRLEPPASAVQANTLPCPHNAAAWVMPNESSRDDPAVRAIRMAGRRQGHHRLASQHALPNEPRYTWHHRKASHARSAVVNREAEVCFEVTVQAWRRLSSLVDASRVARNSSSRFASRGQRSGTSGAVAGGEEQWVAQDGPSLTPASR